MTARLTCDDVRDRELIERYAAGTLEEAEAEALEAHAFECEACWAEMQTALEIHAAMTAAPAESRVRSFATRPARSRRPRLVLPLGLAAALLVGVGLVIATTSSWMTRPAPVMRSGGVDDIRIDTSQQGDGSLTVKWTPHTAATDYLVTVRVAGEVVLTRETSDLAIVVHRERLRSGSSAVVDVTAQSPDGVALAAGSKVLTLR